MKKEKIILEDKVNIIYPQKSNSDLNLKKEKSLIDYKNIFQSDNFSFFKENQIKRNSEKIFANEKILFSDKDFFDKISSLDKEFSCGLKIRDNYVKKDSKKYEILFPENNSTYKVGEYIFFECCVVTENELDKEDFENIIWVSNLDGLIGVKNRFNSMISAGNHIISIISIENESEIIKDTVILNVILNESSLPEINKL